MKRFWNFYKFNEIPQFLKNPVLGFWKQHLHRSNCFRPQTYIIRHKEARILDFSRFRNSWNVTNSPHVRNIRFMEFWIKCSHRNMFRHQRRMLFDTRKLAIKVVNYVILFQTLNHYKSSVSTFEKESYIEFTLPFRKTMWFDTAKLAF